MEVHTIKRAANTTKAEFSGFGIAPTQTWPVLSLLTLVVLLGASATAADRTESADAAYVDHMVDVDGYAIKARTFGLSDRVVGEPLIVFENGSLSTLESWAAIPAQSSDFAPVVLYDRATVGGSEWDGKVGTPNHVADRLWSLLGELNAPPPYILVGWSWGGDLIRYHAARNADDIAGLVFVDPASHSPAAQIELMERLGFGEEGLERKTTFLKEQAQTELAPKQRADIQYIDELLAQRKEHDYGSVPPVPMVALVAGQRSPPPASVLEEMKALPVSMLDEHHALLPGKLDRIEEWVRASDNGLLIYADQSTHYMQGDEAELVLTAIRRVVELSGE